MSDFPCKQKKSEDEEKDCTHPEKCWIQRPRYFPGQLLSDADLRTEQEYFIEKNKLHNRYLHGWGVVCGLKVKCYPCCTGHGSSGKVVVEPGYAIDCCGNDIVVNHEREFDVVGRISQLYKKKLEALDPCGASVATPSAQPCSDAEQKYYLVIRYKEAEDRPATALKMDDGCAPLRCVPSRVWECYELDLVDYCTIKPREDDIFKTAYACFAKFFETYKRYVDPKGFTPKGWLEFIKTSNQETINNFLREYYKAIASHVHCDFLNDLDELKSASDAAAGSEYQHLFTVKTAQLMLATTTGPAAVDESVRETFSQNQHPLSENARSEYKGSGIWVITDGAKSYRLKATSERLTEVSGRVIGTDSTSIIYDVIFDCLLQAILKSCPACTADDQVILATITVKNNKINKICNMQRKWVMTFPTLFYWLPVNRLVKNFFIKQCDKPNQLLGFVLALLAYQYYAKQEQAVNIPQYASIFNKMSFTQTIDLTPLLLVDSQQAAKQLQGYAVEVVGTERSDAMAKADTLEGIIDSIPMVPANSKVIHLVDDQDRTVGFRVVKEDLSSASAEIVSLKRDLGDIKAAIPLMKRDLSATLKTKVPVAKNLDELTRDFTSNILEAVKLEDLKHVDRASALKMKKAGIETPLHLFEAAPVNVSEATKEHIGNAYGYIKEAENAALLVARTVAEEMEKKNVTTRKELSMLDTKEMTARIGKAVKISEDKVKEVVKKMMAEK